MDSRIYFHQYRRPRCSNPTYVSNNISGSLVFYNEKPSQHHREVYRQKQNHFARQGSFQNEASQPRANSLNRYNTINQQIIDQNNNNHYRLNRTKQAPSNLSSYGSNSLSLTQKDIYNKQNNNFNIITMSPKKYNTQIRQYPKYTLENKDQYYYKRMTKEQQNTAMYGRKGYGQQSQRNHSYGSDFIAGKHTYQVEKGHTVKENNVNPEYANLRAKNFTPKMLNHMDQLKSLS